MKNETNELERRLMRITSLSGLEIQEAGALEAGVMETGVMEAGVMELGAEDAELRMGWLALGDLLRRADANQAMPTLQMPAGPLPAAANLRPAQRAATRRHLAMAVMAAALVASVLAMLTLPAGRQTPSPTVPAIAAATPPQALPAITPWNESIDTEIASAGAAVRQAQGSLALATASDQIQYQLDRLSLELDDSSL